MARTTNWPAVRLEEVCEHITVGHVGPMVEEYRESGVPFLRSQNVRPYRFDPSDLKFISPDFHAKLRKSAIKPYDVVVTRSGANTGQCCIIPPRLAEANCSDLVIFRPSDRLNPWFLMYVLNSDWGRATIAGGVVGAAQHHFNIGIAKRLTVQLPPLFIQQGIAAILSAYDMLIENNQHRIQILEQMAQMLYREWFVNFRFPGHGEAAFTTSELGTIPAGWEVKRMDEVADVIDCLHSKKPEHVDGGNGLLLQLFNIGENGKLDLSKKFTIDAPTYKLWTSRIEVDGGDCVITNVGRIAAVAQIPCNLRAALGRNMTAIRPRKIKPTFLIEYLLSPLMSAEVAKKKDAGAIMDSLNVKGIVRLSVPIPTISLMNKFEEIARPMRREIEVLMQKNLNLRSTRDLLLPKLVSGDISVEQIETESVAQTV